MKNDIIFYPMSELPARDESDASFSKTVIVYGDKLNFIDMGYFDFEEGEWSHFGQNIFLLKCWCYIPDPVENNYEKWESIMPKGYKKFFF